MERVTPGNSTLVLLLLACVCGACGVSDRARVGPTKPTHRLWEADPAAFQEVAPGFPIQIPHARHVQEDRPDGDWPRLVANLEADGTITFKGWRFRMGEGERAEALAALGGEITRLLRDPRWLTARGGTRVPLMVHADRVTPWADVADILRLGGSLPNRIESIELAVLRWATPRRDVLMRGVLEPMGAAPHDMRITLGPTEGAPEGTMGLRVVGPVDGYRLQFPAIPNLQVLRKSTPESNRLLDEIELVWSRFDEVLEFSVEPGIRVAIHVPQPADVEYAYVLSTIDLLLGRGVRTIDFTDQSLRIRFGEHEDFDPLDPVALPNQAFPLWQVLLVVLLAFGLPLLGFMTRKRREIPGASAPR